jgi:SAM-dependent methyltransferase
MDIDTQPKLIVKESKREFDPTPENFLNLSLEHYRSQRYRDCIAAAREALKLNPDFPEAFNNISASYLALGEKELAIYAANKALRLKPNFQLAKNNLQAAIAGKTNRTSSEDTPKFSVDWFASNIGNWTTELSYLRGNPNLRFLEIGCFEGRATRWMLDNILTNPSSTIEVIDTFEGAAEHQWMVDNNITETFANDGSTLRRTFEHNVRPFSNQVLIHQGLSHGVLTELAPNRQAYYDFIYIDGSHHQDDVYKDADLTWPLLKNGGILAFDDYEYRWENPDTGEKQETKIGIDRFLGEHGGEYNLLLKGWQLHIRKTREEIEKV